MGTAWQRPFDNGAFVIQNPHRAAPGDLWRLCTMVWPENRHMHTIWCTTLEMHTVRGDCSWNAVLPAGRAHQVAESRRCFT